ncbi:MAG: hypothetical protein FD189_556 [Elusimicrobia bacterium]|nr:MAG: hypothetical protein FD154_555 [Elusimicrobiota bacterium]KAF0157288.1 MAG: hypothetical protein FD189_556 [Elusimicrobiota bacterium]
MKKTLATLLTVFISVASASAWFDGGVGQTTGPGGYKKTDINLTIGSGDMWVRGALMRQNTDNLYKPLNHYSARVGFEKDFYTVAGEAGMTPGTNSSATSEYSNMSLGGDITFSLTPSATGGGRLAGPNAKAASGGGQGITRVDVGAGLKHTRHKTEALNTETKTAQTEYSVFAGAKILMARLGASWTGYKYGDDDSTPIIGSINGQARALSHDTLALPKASVNFRLDLPGYPMVTPFLSYTTTKYKNNFKDTAAYGVGAYLDLNLVGANVMYQVYDDGSDKDNYLSLSAGIKF